MNGFIGWVGEITVTGATITTRLLIEILEDDS